MSTNSKKFDEQQAHQKAARMLMKEFIEEHPTEIQLAMQEVIPYFNFECSMSGLRSSLNVVNVTFATVALDVIKSAVEEEDEEKRHYLPVDASEMRSAIFYLSKAVEAIGPIAALIERHRNDPAFKMTTEAFSKTEVFG